MGPKTNAAMYMSNEYRYLKYILFYLYYAGHGTGVLSVGDTGVPGNLGPPKYGPPGPNFLGNMAPPGAILGNLAPLSEIWPPFTNMDVKQFCARAMLCKCINFVSMYQFNARTLTHKQFQVDFEILKVTFYQER